MKAESLDSESDGALIGRFADERDERAFATIVERRGALVGGVCARMLRHREDAEDASQAVFLVLARRAHALRKDASLSAWLHEVAVRICKAERGSRRRRGQRALEAMEVARDPTRAARLNELKQVIDEELAQLPSRMRQVLVLCDLEGRTRDEAARVLRVPSGTVSSRLARARELLRTRLVRHGITIAAGGVSFTLAGCAEAAPHVSRALVQIMTHNAQIFVAGTDAMKSTLGTKISTLANGALRDMVVAQWKTAACLVVLLVTSVFGGAVAPSLVGRANAGTAFIDDFEDGSFTDDNPVSWFAPPYADGGTRIVENGSLVITSHLPNFSYDTEVQDQEYADVHIRALFRAASEDVVGVYARSTSSGTLGNPNHGQQLYSYITGTGAMQIGQVYEGQISPLGNAQLAWDPTGQETQMEMIVRDNRASVFVWQDGAAKPQSPQLDVDLSSLSNLVERGGVGVWTFAFPFPVPNGPVAFREIEVQPITSTNGDTNFDGQIDLEDLNAVRNHFGEGELGGPRVAGDAYPFDGVVDLEDLNLVRNHFGAGAEGIATPEPAAASLAGAGIGLLLFGLILGRRRYAWGR